MQVLTKDPYDAFILPDGFVMFRHEYHGDQSPEALEQAHVVVVPKGSPDWAQHVDDGK